MNKYLKIILIITLFTALSCNLSPNVNIKETTPKKTDFKGFKEKNTKLDSQRWWEEFNDPNLSEFINRVMSNSLDFKNSDLTVEKFKLLYRISKSNLWPNISLSTGGTRTKTNLRTFIPQGGSFKNSNYSFMFNASYEIDLFQKLNNQKKEAFYSFLNMKETQNSIKLSIIANAANLYFQYSEIVKEIELTEKLLYIQKLELNSVKSKYLNGIVSSEFYLLTVNSVNQTKNNLSQLKEKKAQLEKALKNILSETELNLKSTEFSNIIGNFTPIKPGLPSELLLRRPDIKAAYFDIKSKASAVGVSKANLFPSIKLTGGDGFKTTELSMLFQQKSNVWNFGLNIFQPVFNRGALRNQLHITQKELEITVNNYKKIVINAFSEVDSLLEQYKLIKNEIKNQEKIFNNEKLIEKKKLKDYLSGNDSYENYLKEKEKLLSQQIILNKLYLAYAANRIALYKALGGGIEEINKTYTEVNK